jgi:hypothetical protein
MWKSANNTSVSVVVKKESANKLQETVQEISDWANLNRFQLNPTNCKEMRVSFTKQPRIHAPVNVNNYFLEAVSTRS